MWSVVISIVPRVLIGVAAYYVYELVLKLARGKKGGQTVALGLAGIAGSMTNTILVMNGIYFFFGNSYAAASNKVVARLYDMILGVIVASGSRSHCGGDPDHSHCKGAFKGKKPLVEKNVSYYIIGRY